MDYSSASSTGNPLQSLIGLIVLVIVVAALWKIFTKAGQPGWAALVPFYNVVVLLQIVGRPIWWLVLLLIPFVGIIFSIIITNDLSKSFGRGVGTTLLLILVPFVGYPLLAFGDASYKGPSAGELQPATV